MGGGVELQYALCAKFDRQHDGIRSGTSNCYVAPPTFATNDCEFFNCTLNELLKNPASEKENRYSTTFIVITFAYGKPTKKRTESKWKFQLSINLKTDVQKYP